MCAINKEQQDASRILQMVNYVQFYCIFKKTAISSFHMEREVR